jgi:hypothetical protein
LAAREHLNPYEQQLPFVWHFYENGDHSKPLLWDSNLNAPSCSRSLSCCRSSISRAG